MSIKSIGIIGYGQFGKFIHNLCKTYFPHIEVLISSRTYSGAVPFSQVCKADIVFPCGPIKFMKTQLEEVIEHLGEDSIIWEVTTVKVMPEDVLKEHENVNYICSHPMFGPESYKKNNHSLNGCTLARCSDTLSEDLREQFNSFLQQYKLNIVYMSSEEHDKNLAETLFLTHYISQIVYQAGFDRSKIDTLSFGYLMDAVESVKDNVGLFEDVRKFNSYCKEVVKKFEITNQNVLDSLSTNEVEQI